MMRLFGGHRRENSFILLVSFYVCPTMEIKKICPPPKRKNFLMCHMNHQVQDRLIYACLRVCKAR